MSLVRNDFSRSRRQAVLSVATYGHIRVRVFRLLLCNGGSTSPHEDNDDSYTRITLSSDGRQHVLLKSKKAWSVYSSKLHRSIEHSMGNEGVHSLRGDCAEGSSRWSASLLGQYGGEGEKGSNAVRFMPIRRTCIRVSTREED